MKATTGDITPEEFLARVAAASERMAFNHAHWLDDVVDASLARIANELQRDWRALLTPSEFPDEGLAEVVAQVMRDVRKRKREIEQAGVGTA
jgi:hypothetical protein